VFGGIIGMELSTCPQCGSHKIQPETKTDTVLHTQPSQYLCQICGYEGQPLILEQYEGVFQGLSSAGPRLIGPWEIHTRLDNGEKKALAMLWEDARDCVASLNLKKGDRISVIVDKTLWRITKAESTEPKKKKR